MMPRVVAAVPLTLLITFVVETGASAQMQPPHTVLAVFSGSEDHPANVVFDSAMREMLQSRFPALEYFTEYLEDDQFPADIASASLADYIRQKYQNREVDAVIAITNAALQFVLAHRQDLFRDKPIVFAGAVDPNELKDRLVNSVTGVASGASYAATLDLALRLHPRTERVFVVGQARNESIVAVLRGQLQEFSDRVTLTYIVEESTPRLLSAVKAVPPRSLILFAWYQPYAYGRLFQDVNTARQVADAAPVPVYGINDLTVGSGVVGGVVRSTPETGRRVAQMALRILTGTPPQDIAVETAPVVPMLDWRQVQRWRIDPALIPADADIRFRTPTVWEAYRPYITVTVIVVIAQLIAITGLLIHRSKRQAAEETVREREASLRISFERIRQLAGRLINAQEEARANIARDLHDHVCQELVGVSMSVTTLKSSSGRLNDPLTQQALAELHERTLEIVQGVRNISHDLHPASLRLVGLTAALKSHCVEVEKRHDVQVGFRTAGTVGSIHPDVALCLFRIAQEAMRNAAVHGEARRISVTLSRTGNHLDLMVTDDGTGFDVHSVRRSGGGLGLVSMEERARLVGGRVEVVSAFQAGTVIRVRVPAGADDASQPHDYARIPMAPIHAPTPKELM